ncbi:RNA pseudouridine synthase [Dissulfurirhabdus thermomarina]|uniref:RNA pseudouridine synthase n=1 Tax=Dissulfurirhabdus thermomarina TaxID=1765737 RepID=A0A6N9TWQ3_DISTH|nr:RNA pseudouridine synthase [Dissulfurirhabdus thermomarina]NDY42916.1 RNA pseudouridine synthase [Dissulfurirhabdus thermomarina]NMX24171.1 RNA pseudouridine synthase [Dissulfurirhabdus thermomarina]
MPTPLVLYEDNHLLVLAKAPGVPTVPDRTGDPALLDLGRAYLKASRAKPGNVYLGVVHRLDRPVSGVVCFAVTSKAAARLARQFREGQVQKTYLALVEGRPPGESGRLRHALWKDRRRNRVRLFPPESAPAAAREARTRWRRLAELNGAVLLELTPETGRPHQLRAQCAAMGCPILGDLKYGAAAPLPDQSIALHARRLSFAHPTRGTRLEIEAPPPESPWWRAAAAARAR